MDEQSPAKNRSTETFNVGALAVENSNQPAATKPPLGKIGSLAVKNSEEPLVEPGEQVVTVIRRHIIGVVGIYAEMLIAMLAVLAGVVLAIGGAFGHLAKNTEGLLSAIAVLVFGLLLLILFISVYVYRQCRIIVTDKSLVAITQKALFNRKVSRLSMANVEDVTAEQHGLLATVFNYGTLTVQTAGEEDNFIFQLCPKPNNIAEQVLEARQAYVRSH